MPHVLVAVGLTVMGFAGRGALTAVHAEDKLVQLLVAELPVTVAVGFRVLCRHAGSMLLVHSQE